MKKIIAIISACVLFVGMGCVPLMDRLEADKQVIEAVDKGVVLPLLQVDKHYTKYIFDKNIQKGWEIDLETPPIAMSVPHYQDEMYLCAGALAAAKGAGGDYERVIIIGLNHSGTGARASLSGSGWSTDKGLVSGDLEMAKELSQAFNIAITDEQVRGDHSAAVIVPYIGHYFPNAIVTTLMMNKNLPLSELEKIADFIWEKSKDERLLTLVSIDFSHYQSPKTAAQYDSETQEYIEIGDVKAILNSKGEYLDNPCGMALLSLMAKKNKATPTLLSHYTKEYEDSGKKAASYMIYSVFKE